ncbi:Stp1/IreP family PP2C-type Ser/Thr phosphatase [Myxococcota bacterium]|jgi:protein phosphatase|nr:Stp1/IreP family PP2C-type Ser/Thr phosphatase [Myxococcota bacterium]
MSNTNRRELKRRMPDTALRQPDFKVTGHGQTDVGMRREVNEDSFMILAAQNIYIVADGMGGHAGGQYASTITVDTVGRALVRRLSAAEQKAGPGGAVNIAAVMEEAVREACAQVFDTARERPELTGMGSTVTAMLVYGDKAWFGHVGDSRAYLIRDGKIHQVTEDHSLVQEQVAAGLITAEQAKVSVMRNIITRSIGFERDVKVDVGAVPLQRGDQFVLCSDGLTGHVEDDEILQLTETNDRRRVPGILIRLANERGGEDNSSVILATVIGRRGRERNKARKAEPAGASKAR